MRAYRQFTDFEVCDTSGGERLERWGDIYLIRPDPQVIWNTEKSPLWQRANARYIRSDKGGGSWDIKTMPYEEWNIEIEGLTFKISPTGFKHTGLFPEQAVNWQYTKQLIQSANRPINVLNLFAYTGGATLACAQAGAKVCHVDAAKGMVNWARENAKLSGLESAPIRWIVDDCRDFIAREKRRGVRYDGIIMDPPSYGRGSNGKVWRLESDIYDLITEAAEIMSDNPLFFMVNSYTTGLAPSVMGYILSSVLKGGTVTADEIGLPVTASGLCLPCGATAIWEA